MTLPDEDYSTGDPRNVVSSLAMSDTTTPSATARASGRFVLRLDSGLHAALRAAARDAGLSLNEYCVRKLAAPLGNLAELGETTAIVQRAAALHGDRLLAVAAFGSWVRGEHRRGSDVDVLVVLDPGLALRRRLYDAWDEEPLTVGGLPVQAHLVHPPDDPHRAGGLWAEVALDGVVLFERRLVLSRLLARVRRGILAGQVVRREAGGRTYWVHEG